MVPNLVNWGGKYFDLVSCSSFLHFSVHQKHSLRAVFEHSFVCIILVVLACICFSFTFSLPKYRGKRYVDWTMDIACPLQIKIWSWNRNKKHFRIDFILPVLHNFIELLGYFGSLCFQISEIDRIQCRRITCGSQWMQCSYYWLSPHPIRRHRLILKTVFLKAKSS